MRKISLLLLIFGLIATGCDSNDNGGDGMSDAEAFVGTWGLNQVSDADGEVDLASNFNSIAVTFTISDSFSLVIDAVESGSDLMLNGTYTVEESTNTITLDATIPNVGTIPLIFTYEFDGDNVLLTSGAQTTAALNGVLQLESPLVAPVVFTASPVS
jgi:hypothetical protein